MQRDHTEPLRVGLVGRVSAGKSTLVNAIVGRRVAPTAAQECTRLVTVYRRGAPEAWTCVDADGREHPLPHDPRERDDRLAGIDRPERIDVTLPSAALDDLVLVDTPGLQGASEETDSAVVAALAGFDCLLYLFRGDVRADDEGLATEFAKATGGTRASARRAVGLLSHADAFGAGAFGAEDPIDAARARARELEAAYAVSFARVLAVSTLLGESARTGAITESRTGLLRSLATRPEAELRFANVVPLAGVEPEALLDLEATLAPYGLAHGRSAATTVRELTAWAEERSGFGALQQHLDEAVRPVVHASRLRDAVEALTGLVRGLSGPARPRASDVLERHLGGAGFQVVRELTAYLELLGSAPSHRWRADLEQLLARPAVEDRLAWLRSLDGSADRATILARASRYTAAGSLARLGAEALAARTLSASMVLMAQEVG
ncbi:dynamin family protein [Nocardioides bigeumensis]|uniref:Dynamin N-terminal domain-containing protein n=1 Tax=Nocardioides bigeumensis TaxID=433657 RepID=A0ABP5JZ57_9ACTN